MRGPGSGGGIAARELLNGAGTPGQALESRDQILHFPQAIAAGAAEQQVPPDGSGLLTRQVVNGAERQGVLVDVSGPGER